jgi:hypothetical protein
MRVEVFAIKGQGVIAPATRGRGNLSSQLRIYATCNQREGNE